MLLAVAVLGASLVVLSLVCYLAGEILRSRQREQVRVYCEARSEALRRRQRALREETLRRKKEEERRKEPLAVDTQLNENLAFVQRIAHQTPEIFAAVLKHYVRSDPAVASGKKRPTDPVAFEEG